MTDYGGYDEGSRRPFFERPTIKNLAVAAFFFFLGLAAGNGWVTKDALRGDARWWQGYCHRQVQQHIKLHEQQDLQKYGWR